MTNTRKQKFLKNLTNPQKIALAAAFIGGFCTVVAACVGLSVPLVEYMVRDITGTKVIETPTYSPPTDSVLLPANQSDVLSLVVAPGPSWAIWAGILTNNIDRNTMTQNINANDVRYPGDVSPRFTELNWPSTIWLTLTGKTEGEPVQVSNQVPIRVVSYRKLPTEVDLVTMEIGGGQDVWLMGANISDQALNLPEQIIWAKYTSDLRSRFISAQEDFSPFVENFPNEVQKAISSNEASLPDYFLLENNERIVFSIATFFETPGIYELNFGVEYLYDRYKSIAWADQSIEIYVPQNYYIWACDRASNPDNPMCHLIQYCQTSLATGRECTDK